ncbi:Uncharacterised protein [uncultured archaeon]|nr:Uncharacterised protein [uncultured archaeon]
MEQTSDGGYILAGDTNGTRAWILKADSSGNEEWRMLEGNSGNSTMAWSARQTADGGYAVLVWTSMFDPNWNMWLLKILDVPTTNVTLMSPQSGALLASSNANFSWVPYNFTASPECNLTLDGNASYSGTCTANQACSALLSVLDGSHTWNVSCVSQHQNATSETSSFSVDATPPSLSIDSPSPNSAQGSRTLGINLTVGDANLNYTQISILNSSGSAVNSTTSPDSGSFQILLAVPADGVYNVTAVSHDLAGNNASASVHNITVNTTLPPLPSIVINSPAPDSAYGSLLIPINVTVSSPNLNYTNISIVGSSGTVNSTVNAGTGNYETTLAVPRDGVYNISAVSYDLLGRSNSSEVLNITINTSSPSVAISSPANSTYNGSSLMLNFTASSFMPLASCWYVLDGGNTTTLPGCGGANISGLAPGAHALSVHAQDVNSRNGSASVSFSVAQGQPVTRITFLLKNSLIAPIYLNAVGFGSIIVNFPQPIKFASGDRQAVSFDVAERLCNAPGDFAQLDNLTFYYTQGAITNLTQSGHIPLSLRCS